MKRLYAYCEGQTEETFVKNLLSPYLLNKGITIIPIICRTKEGPQGVYKGGITAYSKVVKEIRIYCMNHRNEMVTSFIDYYGLKGTPQLSNSTNKYDVITELEHILKMNVDCVNFIPYISLHEFESLLFSNPEKFEYLSHRAVIKFKKTLEEFQNNPEFINNGIETAPSKRILKEIENYSKILDGNQIAEQISLTIIRQKCHHFSTWISSLESI